MASACVNNVGVPPETSFSAKSYSSYGWLSPRISVCKEDESKSRSKSHPEPDLAAGVRDPAEIQDPAGDFEFCLEDPVTMLPADELFSDGKLLPLHFPTAVKAHHPVNAVTENISSVNTVKSFRRIEMEISSSDSCLFSPKAPRCSSRWKEILGLKKFSPNSNPKPESQSKTASFSTTNNTTTSKTLKHFLHRSSKTSSSSSSSGSGSGSGTDGSLNLPLLMKDSDCESVSISSSRLSLSSSSSGHEHEDLPRLSLDAEKPSLNLNPSPNPFAPCRSLNPNSKPNPPRMRLVKPRAAPDSIQSAASRDGRSPLRQAESDGVTSRGVSVDSPRLNSSGKIVFQNLGRSSSSPSTFNGGPRYKQRGMERSYSANVRVTPVLNVPVCSLRGSSKSGSVFGFFSSSPQKSGATVGSKGQQNTSSRNRTSIDRN